MDLHELRAAVRRGDFGTADHLYRGVFLEGFSIAHAPEFEAWVEETRDSTGILAAQFLRGLMAEFEAQGRWADCERVARELLRHDSLDQTAASFEIGLLMARGAVNEARARYAAVHEELSAAGYSASQRLQDLGSALADPNQGLQEAPSEVALPMIGRHAEYDRVKAALVSAQSSEGRVMYVYGAPGVGKTRLCEQAQRLAVVKGFRRAAASCGPLTMRLPYSAARQILTCFSTAEHLSVSAELLPTLKNILPSGARDLEHGDDEPLQETLYAAFWSVIANVAKHTPVLITVEDIQWIDHATCELLAYLLPFVERSRCVLLLTGRAGEVPTAASLHHLTSSKAVDRVTLEELADGDAEKLIAAFGTTSGKAVPAELMKRVARLAGGQPFFILELLRAWRRDGPALGNEGSLPSSIQQFLGERFSSLSVVALGVAEALAVLGGRARHQHVPSVAAVSESDYAEAVDELLTKGFVRDTIDELCFLHELVREAAYRRMNHPRRRTLHSRVVKVLRSSSSIDVGALAIHSDLAGNAAAAFRYALAAGGIAARRYGHGEAEEYWRLARKHAISKRGQARAAEYLADSCYRLGRYAEALALYQELLSNENPAPKQLLYRARSTGLRVRLGQVSEADAPLREILNAGRGVLDPNIRLSIFEPVFFAAATANRTELIFEFTSDFVSTAQASGDSVSKVLLLSNLAEFAAFRGAWPEATHFVDLAMESAEKVGHANLVAHVHSARGTLSMLRGDVRFADRCFGLALQILDGPPNRVKRPYILANWAILKTESGEFEEARRLFARSLEWAAETGSVYNTKMALANLAVTEYESGELTKAAEIATKALDVGSDMTAPSTTASTLGLLGLLALQTDLEPPHRYVDRLTSSGLPSERVGSDFSYAEIFLARMSEREGRVKEALERIERGVRMYAGRDFFCHARLELERARLVGVEDPGAGILIAREVRARALEAEAVLVLNKSEALMRELKRRVQASGVRGSPTPSS